MRRRFFSRITMVFSVAFMALLIGCAAGTSAPSRFYLMSPLSGPKAESGVSAGRRCITVGIGPVEIPAYLDRPQIVTRVSENEVRLAEFDRWAEPLSDSIPRVLAENISGLLCAESINVFPWRESAPVQYQVIVEVLRLDGDLGGRAFLLTRWAILEERQESPAVARRSSYSERVEAKDYEALVSSLSRLLEDLSRDIAVAIKSLR